MEGMGKVRRWKDYRYHKRSVDLLFFCRVGNVWVAGWVPGACHIEICMFTTVRDTYQRTRRRERSGSIEVVLIEYALPPKMDRFRVGILDSSTVRWAKLSAISSHIWTEKSAATLLRYPLRQSCVSSLRLQSVWFLYFPEYEFQSLGLTII